MPDARRRRRRHLPGAAARAHRGPIGRRLSSSCCDGATSCNAIANTRTATTIRAAARRADFPAGATITGAGELKVGPKAHLRPVACPSSHAAPSPRPAIILPLCASGHSRITCPRLQGLCMAANKVTAVRVRLRRRSTATDLWSRQGEEPCGFFLRCQETGGFAGERVIFANPSGVRRRTGTWGHSVSGVRKGFDLSSLRSSCSAACQNSSSRPSGLPACSHKRCARSLMSCSVGSDNCISCSRRTAPPWAVWGAGEAGPCRPAIGGDADPRIQASSVRGSS